MNMRPVRKMTQWLWIGLVLVSVVSSYGQQAESKGKPEAPEAKAQTAQAAAQAEAPQDERNFQLSFVARELDETGKVVNSRRFDTMATAGSSRSGGVSNIRTGAKIPVAVSSGNGTYMDVGANFDVNRPRIVKGNRLAMQVSAEISSVDPTVTTEGRPAIRQNRWMGDVEIPIGGHKVIFSSDDLASKRTMQIELTVTAVSER